MAKYPYIYEIDPTPYDKLTDMAKHRLKELGIINGFGGASKSWIARWLIGIIMNDFDTAIPDRHDYSYYQGVEGMTEFSKEELEKIKKYCPEAFRLIEEKRRQECDEKFYQAILNDIRSLYDEGEIGKWELLWKSIIANLAYYAIRWKGSKYFNYSE